MKHFDTQLKDLSQQFSDQVKCIDAKLSVDIGILGNILELYKRRATIEHEYADNLMKLSASMSQKTNLENQRKPKWKNYSPASVLTNLIATTQHTAKAHKSIGEIYGKQMTQRLTDMQDDASRLNRKCVEIMQKQHAVILKSLSTLSTRQKNYIKAFADADDARRKANKVMDQLDREVIRSTDKKKELDKNPKIKKLKEDYLERQKLYKEKQDECTISRNKYIIHVFSLKDVLNHFYNKGLKTIVQCSEYGFHNNLTRLCTNHASCEEGLISTHDTITSLFTGTIENIDASKDTDVFFESNRSVLTLKENLYFLPAKEDNVKKVSKSQPKVHEDLETNQKSLSEDAVSSSHQMTNGKQKIDSLSKTLNELINQTDYDVMEYICKQSEFSSSVKEKSASLSRENSADILYTNIQKKVKDKRLEMETMYLNAMEEYLQNEARFISCKSKLERIQSALDSSSDNDELTNSLQDKIQPQTALMIGMKSKLFGGGLKKFCAETHTTVPEVILSCIRLINVYGMRNMGVFRVPGCQTDVQEFKSKFEFRLDPLKSLKGTTNDVNLAASILKLYLRELDPPVFDKNMFHEIVTNYENVKQNESKIVDFLRNIVTDLDSATYTTMNYLLTFLKHLAEHSSDNCMDIMNLAIIFGPCLMPIPEDKNSQLFQYQGIVNHVTQCLITNCDEIFTKETSGPHYQRVQKMSVSSEDTQYSDLNSVNDVDKTKFFDDTTVVLQDDDYFKAKRIESARIARPTPITSNERNRNNSDSKETQFMKAVALCNNEAKQDEELSFKVGDNLVLKDKFNDSYWNGYIVSMTNESSPSKIGLIPSSSVRIIRRDSFDTISDKETIPCFKQRESDVSSPESQRLSEQNSHKRSMASMDSDNDLDISPDDNHSLTHSLGNTFSEESKSLASLDNIIDDELKLAKTPDEIDDSVKISLDSEPLVKIRGNSRASVSQSSEQLESIDIIDEELQQAIQGLSKIEELNMRKHRSTIHIDKSLLASKFINPILESSYSFTQHFNQSRSQERLTREDSPLTSMTEYKVKKPGNVSSLASTFEIKQSPKGPVAKQVEAISSLPRSVKCSSLDEKEENSVPPPVKPKPKFNKK